MTRSVVKWLRKEHAKQTKQRARAALTSKGHPPPASSSLAGLPAIHNQKDGTLSASQANTGLLLMLLLLLLSNLVCFGQRVGRFPAPHGHSEGSSFMPVATAPLPTLTMVREPVEQGGGSTAFQLAARIPLKLLLLLAFEGSDDDDDKNDDEDGGGGSSDSKPLRQSLCGPSPNAPPLKCKKAGQCSCW
jgi:hypothetical protein